MYVLALPACVCLLLYVSRPFSALFQLLVALWCQLLVLVPPSSFSFTPIGLYFSVSVVRAREGLAQPQACRLGVVSAAPCLQVAAGELAAATRLQQAMLSNTCTCVGL